MACPFCGHESNIRTIQHHLKTKKCKQIQEIKTRDKPEALTNIYIKLDAVKKIILKYGLNETSLNNIRSLLVIDDPLDFQYNEDLKDMLID